jgi:hypothetical protein
VKRLGEEVKRELGRFGPQGAMPDLVEAWPAAVGETIARKAWPARVARDGTLHVNTEDSVWAFELGSRAAEIAERLGVQRVRFAPGPLPEPATEGLVDPRGAVAEPSERARREAARLVAPIEDENLRKIVARAAALSLETAAADRSVW